MTITIKPVDMPSNLRVADLIAKTARVTLKDTMRVLAALDAVGYLYDVGPTEIVEGTTYSPERPSPENVAACEQAFFSLRDPGNKHAGNIRKRIKLIKSLA